MRRNEKAVFDLNFLKLVINPQQIGPVVDNPTIPQTLGAHDTYLLTYSFTPWCRVFLEQLTGLQLVKKFPAFHGTIKFITALTNVRQPNPVHITTSHLLEIHPNIIHPSTPRSPQWSLSLRFPHQDPIHPLSSPISTTCRC